MDHVAQAIANIRAVFSGDIIIGGEASQYLDDDAITNLKRRVEALSPFHSEHFSLRKSRCTDDQNIIGAALRFVQSYVTDICNTEV